MRLSEKRKTEVFGDILQRYQAYVIKLAYSYVRDSHCVEDIAQEVFVDAYKSLEKLKDYDKLTGWLRAVTRNKCVDFIKRNSRKIISIDEIKEEMDVEIGDVEDARSKIYGRERSRNAFQIIDTLPDNQRQALILRHTEHVSYKEIAEMLGITITALKSLLFRARCTLRREMAKIENKAGEDAL
jgi:RNA polymerase sigma-70 factor, ECF subfamily